jgi:hypothetical protein
VAVHQTNLVVQVVVTHLVTLVDLAHLRVIMVDLITHGLAVAVAVLVLQVIALDLRQLVLLAVRVALRSLHGLLRLHQA